MLSALITILFIFSQDILYWIKWSLAYVTIHWYIATRGKRVDLYIPNAEGDPEKCGFLVPQVEIDLESPQSENHLKKSTDEIIFYGVNSKAECLLVRIARCLGQEAEAWIYLKMADGLHYYLKQNVSYQQPFEEKSMIFSCENLIMHYILPMRKWRIQYYGPLTKKSKNMENDEETVFVKFVFLWTASSDVYDSSLDSNPRGFASAAARSDWNSIFSPPIQRFSEALNVYSQVGNLRGTVVINEENEVEANLFGEKIRNLVCNSCTSSCIFETLLGYIPSSGFGVHLVKATIPNLFKDLSVGFVIKPSGFMHAIKDLEIFKNIKADFKIQKISGRVTTVSGTNFELTGHVLQDCLIPFSGQGQRRYKKFSFVTFTIGKKVGYGLYVCGKVSDEPTEVILPTVHKLWPKSVPLAVKIGDVISQFHGISGGKGSSLGKLTELSHRDKTFIVPKGIIITTAAYDTFLTEDILNAVKTLENIAYKKSKGDVKKASEAVVETILNIVFPYEVNHSIRDNLENLFGDEFSFRKFAVRSSATGEDTDAMSAAGQMKTFLGVHGLENILFAVKKCWASQFSLIAIEYKRQNGQVLNSPMAVVIQEMVACEVSGVLFTCDPVSNNPSVITITANYGLGKTVVSGSVEPDTIKLEKGPNDNLLLTSTNIGSKHQRMFLKDSEGTVTEDLTENNSTSCISQETALKLAKVGIKIEKFYRSSRDIEWGLLKDKVYLFQSRPVTSGAAPTNFEMRHEFDSFLRCESEFFSRANTGEVMPGAHSPLQQDIISKNLLYSIHRYAYEQGISSNIYGYCKYFCTAFRHFYCQSFISAPEIYCRFGHGTMLSKGYIISYFGRLIEDPEIDKTARERFPVLPKNANWKNLIFLIITHLNNAEVEQIRKHINNYNMFFLKCETAEETFKAIMKTCSDFYKAMAHLLLSIRYSSHWNTLMLSILYKAKGCFDIDVYGDFAKLLSIPPNAESAEVPSAMQKLANQLVKDISAETFKAMSLEEAEKWLHTSNTLSSEMYQEFMLKHGHRCFKELDVYSIPWRQDQKVIIALLQTLVGNTKEESEKLDEDYSKIFSELQVPLNFLQRLQLRLILPFCRRGVKAREALKSQVVKSTHIWRRGYQHLSELMVGEGRLPDKELLYFMTLEEIRTLLKTRCPRIIARAVQRRKIYPVLDNYQFPEITRGAPIPINEDDDMSKTSEFKTDLAMQGTPVFHGVVRGYARVATSLTEAENLKPGEILITQSTDIAWSPYFPIISGVVTELGGLVSHGAVISREYGLPCVVGLRGATKQFKTGDYVFLDGKEGVLQRISSPQEKEEKLS